MSSLAHIAPRFKHTPWTDTFEEIPIAYEITFHWLMHLKTALLPNRDRGN
jgi:hypothetical protein